MSVSSSPRAPIFIPSKGRSQFMMTSKVLSGMGVDHFVIAEPAEFKDYKAAAKGLRCEVLKLDMKLKERYDYCDPHGLSKSSGSGPARNFAWDQAKKMGAPWHWVMDDNIRAFYRLNNNEKHKMQTGAPLAAMEDFSDRYTNVAMAGPQYEMFIPRRRVWPPFITNTRVYSCNLIRTDAPFRWRGRYNEDTILSLDMLKAGWCTILFNAFLQDKVRTQTMPGGNTDALYDGGMKDGKAYSDTGTTAKSQMLADVHPDCARVSRRFNRTHHHVDYARFRMNGLVRRADVKPRGVNNYGMKLKPVTKEKRNG